MLERAEEKLFRLSAAFRAKTKFSIFQHKQPQLRESTDEGNRKNRLRYRQTTADI